MANLPTAFVNATSVTAREAEVTAADFDNGANAGAACAPGIGIATDVAGLTGATSGWTLKDQTDTARTPQDSQHIGGTGLGAGVAGAGTVGIDVVTPSSTGDGTGTIGGDAHLVSLAAGWAAVVV